MRDAAGPHAFDNALFGVRLTGAQLKDHPERSVSCFTPPADPCPPIAVEVIA
ncbi:hypothetical protein ACFFSW_04275 [Saccharothrix longispora]|uniref:Uncharacterized protein n=1 Tax=Saccharothrix longispora TaxID=33920 RepID=A0ABU1PPN3_9PSEU|nr:hypothetical protein [Saccharothrix longispora]MDR6592044.1 hypothetical protein [Saccharothrix longispora]